MCRRVYQGNFQAKLNKALRHLNADVPAAENKHFSDFVSDNKIFQVANGTQAADSHDFF